MPTTVTAQERHTEHLSSIEQNLKTLTAWVIRSKMAALIDWRDVGDASVVDDYLAMACEFLEDDPEGARWLAAHRNDV